VSEDERRARAIVRLMSEVERAGGRIRPEKLLEIGTAQNSRKGIGGFYGPYLEMVDGFAVLHDAGKARLKELRDRYGIE
jgi:hypothetical protein